MTLIAGHRGRDYVALLGDSMGFGSLTRVSDFGVQRVTAPGDQGFHKGPKLHWAPHRRLVYAVSGSLPEIPSTVPIDALEVARKIHARCLPYNKSVGGFCFLIGGAGFLMAATNDRAFAAGLIGLSGVIVAIGSMFGIAGGATPIARSRFAAGLILVAVVVTFVGATVFLATSVDWWGLAGYLLPGLFLVAAVMAYMTGQWPTTKGT